MRADSHAFRSLSWNVHGFVGRARRRDPEAVMHAVRELDADIVALQEIDERPRGRDEKITFVTLTEAFGPHSTEARTIRSPDGDYGHVLMSRWPMAEVECLNLTVRRREPRMAISCTVESPAGEIRVLAAHLGLSRPERRKQLGVITDHLEKSGTRAAIVLGDFNEWRRIGAATRTLCPPFVIAAGMPTFPSRRPLFPLDRIWCRPPVIPISARVATEYGHLSDHLAVVSDFELAPTDSEADDRATHSCHSSGNANT